MCSFVSELKLGLELGISSGFCLELGLELKLGFSVRVMVSVSPRVRSRFCF